jgi:hypothetical protein
VLFVKTDAYAFGIVLIELVISAVDAVEEESQCQITLDARALVDDEGEVTLARAVEARATGGSCWADSRAKHAVNVLGKTAASCIAPSSRRQAPAHVLPLLETTCQALLLLDTL